jgi:hypothetical protein
MAGNLRPGAQLLFMDGVLLALGNRDLDGVVIRCRSDTDLETYRWSWLLGFVRWRRAGVMLSRGAWHCLNARNSQQARNFRLKLEA